MATTAPPIQPAHSSSDIFTSSLVQKLDGELICGVCLELFKTPLLLPCGHNFCKACIEALIYNCQSFSFISIGPPTSFNCPVCQSLVNLHHGNIAHLPINRALESIVNMYKECSPVNIFDGAWNLDMDIKSGLCAEHRLDQDQFCDSCNIVVCPTCAKLNHSGQKAKHRVESLKRCVISYQAEISDTVSDLKKKMVHLTDKIKHLETIMSDLKTNEEYVLKQAGEQVSAVMAAVRAQHEDLKRRVTNQTRECQKPIEEELHKCQSINVNAQELIKKLSSIRKTKDVGLKLQLMKDTCTQLNTVLCYDLAWCLQNSETPEVVAPDWHLDIQPVLGSIQQLSWQSNTDISATGQQEGSTGNVSLTSTEFTRNTSPTLVDSTKNVPQNSTDKFDNPSSINIAVEAEHGASNAIDGSDPIPSALTKEHTSIDHIGVNNSNGAVAIPGDDDQTSRVPKTLNSENEINFAEETSVKVPVGNNEIDQDRNKQQIEDGNKRHTGDVGKDVGHTETRENENYHQNTAERVRLSVNSKASSSPDSGYHDVKLNVPDETCASSDRVGNKHSVKSQKADKKVGKKLDVNGDNRHDTLSESNRLTRNNEINDTNTGEGLETDAVNNVSVKTTSKKDGMVNTKDDRKTKARKETKRSSLETEVFGVMKSYLEPSDTVQPLHNVSTSPGMLQGRRSYPRSSDIGSTSSERLNELEAGGEKGFGNQERLNVVGGSPGIGASLGTPGSSNRTPPRSSNAEALAKFVARRKTISPSASSPVLSHNDRNNSLETDGDGRANRSYHHDDRAILQDDRVDKLRHDLGPSDRLQPQPSHTDKRGKSHADNGLRHNLDASLQNSHDKRGKPQAHSELTGRHNLAQVDNKGNKQRDYQTHRQGGSKYPTEGGSKHPTETASDSELQHSQPPTGISSSNKAVKASAGFSRSLNLNQKAEESSDFIGGMGRIRAYSSGGAKTFTKQPLTISLDFDLGDSDNVMPKKSTNV